MFMSSPMALNIMTLALTFLSSLFITTISILFLIYIKQHRVRRGKELPPGDMGFPWLGETMDFYKAQQKNRIFEEFVQPRTSKHGKIFKTWLMGSPTVVVNGADANRFFLSNEFKLVRSSWPSSSVQLMGKHSIMEKQGDSHRLIRNLISTSLSPNGMETMVPKICQSVTSHLEKHWANKANISLFRSAKRLTFTIVFECFLGVKVEPNMLEMFERVLEGVFALPIDVLWFKFSRAKKARREIEKVLVSLVSEKRRDIERGDEEDCMLFGRLVSGVIRGEISEEELVDNVVLLVFAAHDTTSFAIAMTLKMMYHHPSWFSKVLQEHEAISSERGGRENLTMEDVKKMKYTWQVARESMRLFPPIFGSFRKAITDIEYEGFLIPKGWKVLWTTYGTHNNTEYFEDPLAFDPSRFGKPIQPYVFVPFGGGPRICAGYQLAKLNILIFVHFVVTRYNWTLQRPDEAITMDPLPLPSQGMPVTISPKL